MWRAKLLCPVDGARRGFHTQSFPPTRTHTESNLTEYVWFLSVSAPPSLSQCASSPKIHDIRSRRGGRVQSGPHSVCVCVWGWRWGTVSGEEGDVCPHIFNGRREEAADKNTNESQWLPWHPNKYISYHSTQIHETNTHPDVVLLLHAARGALLFRGFEENQWKLDNNLIVFVSYWLTG